MGIGGRERMLASFSSMPRNPRTIAFLGNYVPRKAVISPPYWHSMSDYATLPLEQVLAAME
jgi:hypothetical protein